METCQGTFQQGNLPGGNYTGGSSLGIFIFQEAAFWVNVPLVQISGILFFNGELYGGGGGGGNIPLVNLPGGDMLG